MDHYIHRNLCIQCLQIEVDVVVLHILAMVHNRRMSNLRFNNQLDPPHPLDEFPTATNKLCNICRYCMYKL